MTHISEEQVRELLPMAKALELAEECFRRLGQTRLVNHPRQRLVLETGAMLHYMAAGDNDSGFRGAKLYSSARGQAPRFVVILFDGGGAPVATIDADALGQIRTGAATGVATKLLSRENAAELGLIGTGFQARTQLEAVAAVRTIRRARVFGRSEERRRRFAEEMSEQLGIAVEAASSAREAVEGADIIVTITTARQPVVNGSWLKPGCHVNAAGSNHPQRRELDAETVERTNLVVVDSLEQAKIEAGDLIQAEREQRFDWNRARELGNLLNGAYPGRVHGEEITLFESQGLAVLDLVAAAFLYQRCAGK